jgi:hypothetical protein
MVILNIMEVDSANKVFDGLAADLIIAVNHRSALSSMLTESGVGLQLYRDVSVAARQLQELADHPDCIARAKTAAREPAEDRFSRDKLAKQRKQALVRAVEIY